MSDPRRLEVSNTSAKKSEVVDRTLSERKYCAIDQFYYSEMFTCPICYGAEQERARIIKLLEPLATCDPELCGENSEDHYREDCSAFTYQYAINLIKGEQK